MMFRWFEKSIFRLRVGEKVAPRRSRRSIGTGSGEPLFIESYEWYSYLMSHFTGAFEETFNDMLCSSSLI